MLGDRKHDFPQTFSYHTPWWDDYRGQADYFARLSLALSSGFQVNDILVIEPTTSAWMHYVAGAENAEMNKIGEDFHRFIDKLEYCKLEYDLASEKSMRDSASAENGKLLIGKRSYSTVVLPYGLSNIDRSTFENLQNYLETGGILYSFNGTPAYIDGNTSGEVSELFSEFKEQVFFKSDPGESGLIELETSNDISFEPLEEAEKVYFMRRKLSDGEIIFLSNFNKGEEKKFNLIIKGMRDVIEMNPVSGEFHKVDFEKKDNSIHLSVVLNDAGSRLYFVSPDRIKQKTTKVSVWKGNSSEEIFISGIRREEPNVIALDYCYLDFPGSKENNEDLTYFYNAHDKIFQKHGFPDNPWVSSSQFKTEIVDRDTFGMNSGFTVAFPAFINEGTDIQSIQLVVERPELYKVLVNETELEAIPDLYYLAKGPGVYAAGDAHVSDSTYYVCR
jgi:hypothetical protein